MKKIILALLCCFFVGCAGEVVPTKPQATKPKQAYIGFSARFYEDEEDERKPEILKVLPGSPAEKAGLKAGDKLIRIGGKTIQTSDGFPILNK
jgi:C-terminal processing protease CtpA/Prc